MRYPSLVCAVHDSRRDWNPGGGTETFPKFWISLKKEGVAAVGQIHQARWMSKVPSFLSSLSTCGLHTHLLYIMYSRTDSSSLVRSTPRSVSNDTSSARQTTHCAFLAQTISSAINFWNSKSLRWRWLAGTASALLIGAVAGLGYLKWLNHRAHKTAAQTPPDRRIPEAHTKALTGFTETLPSSVTNDDGTVNYGIFKGAIKKANVEADSLPLPFVGPLASLRHKKWHFHAIETDDLYITLAVLHAGYATKAVMLLYRKASGQVYTFDSTAPFNFGLTSFAQSSVDPASATAFNFGSNSIDMLYVENQHWLVKGSLLLHNANGTSQAVRCSFEMLVTDSHASTDQFSLVFPFTELSPAYTHKAMCLATSGHLKLGTEMFSLSDNRGSLDWTSVYAPYLTRWQWLFVSGTTKDNKQFGINISSLDHYHSSENAIWLNGSVHLVGPVRFVIPASPKIESQDDASQWIIQSEDGKMVFIFTPTYKKSVPMKTGIIDSNYLQLLGNVAGKFDIGGVVYEIDKVFGICERQQCMW